MEIDGNNNFPSALWSFSFGIHCCQCEIWFLLLYGIFFPFVLWKKVSYNFPFVFSVLKFYQGVAGSEIIYCFYSFCFVPHGAELYHMLMPKVITGKGKETIPPAQRRMTHGHRDGPASIENHVHLVTVNKNEIHHQQRLFSCRSVQFAPPVFPVSPNYFLNKWKVGRVDVLSWFLMHVKYFL